MPSPRFSSRLSWNLPTNRLSLRIAERRAAGQSFVDLTESNPTACGLAADAAALRAALATAQGAQIYAPDPRGLASARATLAAHEGGDPADYLLTASTSEAYALLFKLLADPGDTLLAPRPSYPLFEHLAGAEGVALASYPLMRDDGWRIDTSALAQLVEATLRARAILVVSPNHPTGTFLHAEDRAALATLAERHGLALVIDEVFARYAYDGSPPPAPPEDPVLGFSLGGLSKTAGLPQLKLAWIRASGPPALRREALARLELVADAYLSVATPVQLALPALLDLGDEVRARILARVRSNRATLAARVGSPALAATGVSLLPAAAGWSAILRFPAVVSDEELALAALDRGVLVHPGYFFDLDDGGTFLVVSLLPTPDDFARGLDALFAG
jgi:alanine-synthesizing transaminase